MEPCHARQDCFQRENSHPLRKNMLYVHIPFCASRCRYCPYYTHPYSPGLLEAYWGALVEEATRAAETPYVRSTRFECVYIGGGTPSLLGPGELEKLSLLLHDHFHLTADAEVTLEANPFTLTKEKIALLRCLGFNRVSLGVQSFQDSVLRQMRCAHSAAQAKRVIQSVLEQEVVLNVDLLFGWAGQTQADLKFELEQLCQDGLPHQVTMFPLRMIRGTPLADELERQGTLELVKRNGRLLELDALAEKHLLEHSFLREEAPTMYWRKNTHPHRYHSVQGRILGLGAGAGSVLDGADSLNHPDVTRYVTEVQAGRWPVGHDAPVTEKQARERFVLFRILFTNRSLAGFKDLVQERFEEYFAEPLGSYYDQVVQDMIHHGYVELVGGRIVFTERLWKVLVDLRFGTPSLV
jgi:oxygen-independent coproporphyrinogen-3 oxidase